MTEVKQESSDLLSTLIRKRGSIKSRLTKFDAHISKYPADSLLPEAERDEIELRMAKIEVMSLEYDEVQLQIECLADDPDEQYEDREIFDDKFFNTMVRARALVAKAKKAKLGSSINGSGSEAGSATQASGYAKARSATSNKCGSDMQRGSSTEQEDDSAAALEGGSIKQKNGSTAAPEGCFIRQKGGSATVRPFQINLPTISLPKFNGDLLNWLEFRDTYRSLVHDNDSLDTISKYHYLRASLDGSASRLISSLELTTSNYSIAWDTLTDRFDNNRLLVNNYIKALFDVKQPRETSKELRYVMDTFNKNLRSLKALGEATDGWDTLLIHMLTTKLDPCTLKEWETYRSSLGIVKYTALNTFLQNRADLLENLERHSCPKTSTLPKPQLNRGLFTTNKSPPSAWKCVVCKGDHTIYHCVEFLKEPMFERKEMVAKLKLCQNCLRVGHAVTNCRHQSCRVCYKRHNSLLHDKEEDLPQKDQGEHSKIVTTTARTPHQVLLSTACVNLLDKDGNAHTVRALLDCGSTSCFVTEKLAKLLQPPITAVNTTVTGLNNRPSSIDSKCVLQMYSLHGKFTAAIDCYVISQITEPLPAYKINNNGLEIPTELLVELADPDFLVPGDIDLLLGADIFWNLIETKRIHLGKDRPTLQETKLGWVVSGSVPAPPKIRCHFASTLEVQEQLAKFWELEEVSNVKPWSEEEHICEKIYKSTTERLSDGRFLVQVPLKLEANALGESFTMAEKRFSSLERKLQRYPKLLQSYKEFLDEYEGMGHMAKVLASEKVDKDCYLPHHAVIREDSLTTKLRVVFDASAKTSSGLSFNDIQLVGPVVQDDIMSILLRFRQHAIVISGDIAKMYRQILVRQEQRPLQRIIWRDNKEDEYTIYQLNTVTYGTASAPYLAIRCLKQLADECEDRSIGTVIEHDFYVDDLLSGADTVEEATRICQEVNKQLLSGCLELRKWRSNNATVLKNLSDVAAQGEYTFSESQVSKTLGLLWNSETDTLSYKITIEPSDKPITKRTILATISQIFDPLGLVSPTVIRTKVLLQKLWLQKLSWDDPVSKEIARDWDEVIKTLPHLNTVNIPRHVSQITSQGVQIHIFCDASEVAYGACAYVRSSDSNDTVHSHLLCAKAKVAPLKSTTLPRLELCGALAASRLCQKIQSSLRIDIDKFVFWCDSSIVLGWLGTQPNALKTFVRNRVSKIQEATAPFTWRYVASDANPADVLSRGTTADAIGNHQLWWQGPLFLTKEEQEWPVHNCINAVELPEQRIISNVVTDHETGLFDELLDRCSTLTKVKRVTAYVLRFINNVKIPQSARVKGSLSCAELEEAFMKLVSASQLKHFDKEIEVLQSNGTELPRKSPLIRLQPFLCPKGILRIRGRLSQSNASFDVKHPMILAKRDLLTIKIFEDQHQRLMHAGPQLLLAEIRQRFWPLDGRNLARSIVHKCVTCTKLAARVNYPVMGDLPSSRVEASMPFDVTGIDYAGPVMISSKKGRGARYIKAYICVFVCFATKAIHLELASDMTSATFILALKRFIARRGKPSHIHCDNGSNFIGGWNDLKSKLTDSFANEGIQFHFIPPHAPHFGGLWEAGVKSTKHHLKRVLGSAHLTYEELLTTLVQIEAILNSRPLTPLSSSPIDLTPLTPGHLLIGRPLTALPEPTCSAGNARLRYTRIEQLRQQFWHRWNREYLSELQKRTKWTSTSPPIAVGDLVVLKEDFTPPLEWKMGRITNVHPGHDGVVRVVDVWTGAGTSKRPVTKICPLELPHH